MTVELTTMMIVWQPFLELCEEILDQQKGEGDQSAHLNSSDNGPVTLNKPNVHRQDSADTQMEKGELPAARRGWCCTVS